MKYIFAISILFSIVAFSSCTRKIYKTTVTTENYHSPYDDTTLTVNNSSILMPYNRFIDPAGTVIRFGRTSLENHSLDCILIKGGTQLAVEDRYGVAFIDVATKKLLYHLDYGSTDPYRGLMSTYSGIKCIEKGNDVHLFWGASNPSARTSYLLEAVWNGKKASFENPVKFDAADGVPVALPNDIAINTENGTEYLYVVLGGNGELVKMQLSDKKIVWKAKTGMSPFGVVLTPSAAYVTNWAGPVPTDTKAETAGIPYGRVYVDPKTGATQVGTLSVIDYEKGVEKQQIEVGLHPNAIIRSSDSRFVYVSNGNSDNVSVISTSTNKVVETMSVAREHSQLLGSSPNALALNEAGGVLYVSNGMDNAIAVIRLGANVSVAGKGKTEIEGYIPTEAYPAGLVVNKQMLYVCNLEGEGARASNNKTYTPHQQEATVSIIPLPDEKTLKEYSTRVDRANLLFRQKLSEKLPREGIAPKFVPERIGEPSVFKHVVYIIKENKTYDQVLGDMPEGDGMKSLCVFGDSVTPNQHKIAREYLLLDNYYVSGKSSAEGHSWANAAIVTDYVEKNVRAWFMSYPHVLADAMVYSKGGYIWNHALGHGKSVRIYGEACEPNLKKGVKWADVYQMYLKGEKIPFLNSSTIANIRPLMSETYPCYEGQTINDQVRADAFIKELQDYEKLPGDQLPQLMVMALPADHTAGMREGFPTPRAMVADNDLALGRIMEALTKSRFWDSTVVFVTEDDSQSGWDHVSAYRTTGFVLSAYSHLQKTVRTNYNQTSVIRTIEQILGIPPMNIIDATALPMYDCFTNTKNMTEYSPVPNRIPLNEMNKPATSMKGMGKKFTLQSAAPEFAKIDSGNDDQLNRIIWYSVNGKEKYPAKWTLPKRLRSEKEEEEME
ncbi:MAG: bifunctional YncE family protein/alkaline phosphatase family protein [Candidatus Dadabacteria bacterium]